jgi:hypothetical protein
LNSDENKSLLKQAGSFAGNAASFLLNQGDKSDIDRIFYKQFGSNQVSWAKADLFQCFNLIPCEYFQSKFIPLLHPIVEVIVHEEGGPFKIPSIAKTLLDR